MLGYFECSILSKHTAWCELETCNTMLCFLGVNLNGDGGVNKTHPGIISSVHRINILCVDQILITINSLGKLEGWTIPIQEAGTDIPHWRAANCHIVSNNLLQWWVTFRFPLSSTKMSQVVSARNNLNFLSWLSETECSEIIFSDISQHGMTTIYQVASLVDRKSVNEMKDKCNWSYGHACSFPLALYSKFLQIIW